MYNLLCSIAYPIYIHVIKINPAIIKDSLILILELVAWIQNQLYIYRINTLKKIKIQYKLTFSWEWDGVGF